ncbi:DUF4229 domain-containing protein [Myceligenerans crystallogenes]|uniref:DUF4229 domain-containing protein n=1 Tax=Myceligenerans crystallogenes TaxID=316335 RepID=UPI0031D29AE1
MPLVIYTVLRLALFAGAVGLLYVAGLRSWLLVGVGALVAFALSYVLLARPRDAAARWLAERRDRRRTSASTTAAADAAHEDAAVDRATDGES